MEALTRLARLSKILGVEVKSFTFVPRMASDRLNRLVYTAPHDFTVIFVGAPQAEYDGLHTQCITRSRDYYEIRYSVWKGAVSKQIMEALGYE